MAFCQHLHCERYAGQGASFAVSRYNVQHFHKCCIHIWTCLSDDAASRGYYRTTFDRVLNCLCYFDGCLSLHHSGIFSDSSAKGTGRICPGGQRRSQSGYFLFFNRFVDHISLPLLFLIQESMALTSLTGTNGLPPKPGEQ